MAKLKEAGVTVEEDIDGIRVISTGKGLKAVDIKTLPYPGSLQICKLNSWRLLLLRKAQVQ